MNKYKSVNFLSFRFSEIMLIFLSLISTETKGYDSLYQHQKSSNLILGKKQAVNRVSKWETFNKDMFEGILMYNIFSRQKWKGTQLKQNALLKYSINILMQKYQTNSQTNRHLAQQKNLRYQMLLFQAFFSTLRNTRVEYHEYTHDVGRGPSHRIRQQNLVGIQKLRGKISRCIKKIINEAFQIHLRLNIPTVWPLYCTFAVYHLCTLASAFAHGLLKRMRIVLSGKI